MGLLKKTLAPGQKRPQENEQGLKAEILEEASQKDQRQTREGPENGEPAKLEQLTQTSASMSDDEAVDAEPLTSQMEERASEYRHMVMMGDKITEDWPPPETPTWSQWHEVVLFPFMHSQATYDS